MKKVNVCVVVYDRFDNIKEWCRVWAMCETSDANLVIIHNYENEHARDAYAKFCAELGAVYIPRVNVGFDIGAFQDVCRGRITLPPAEYMLWCPDDLSPMRPGFLAEYLRHFTDTVRVVAYEVSTEVRRHIRTTGFMMASKDLQEITFPIDPITTKWHCYQFEHREPGQTFLDVIEQKGWSVMQVHRDVDHSCMWDKGHQSTAAKARRTRRGQEYAIAFPKKRPESNELVTVICPIYRDRWPQIVASMQQQTHQNWHLILVHDGPCDVDLEEVLTRFNDPRVTFRETPERQGSWGHYIRKQLVSELPDNGFVVITNSDNHHVPVYLEYMIRGFDKPSTVATYCSMMVHSYLAWKVIMCKLIQGYLDCAGVMVRAHIAKQVGWNHTEAHSSDWLYFSDIANAHGWHNFKKVEGCLLIHN